MSNINTWPGWECVEVLGKGSFGSVYKIQREDMGHIYQAALKVIPIPNDKQDVKEMLEMGMTDEDLTTYYQTTIRNLSNEFALMSELKGISNIVSYEDHRIIPRQDNFGWDILIRMELLTPLPKYIKFHSFEKEDVVKMGIGLCRALEICQKKGILHRDIKPANIFISKNGDYKLGDFGVSRTIESTKQASTKVGTYNYMAPEIYRGQKYDHSADIYSLGMVMYQYLNDGQLPFMKGIERSFENLNQVLEKRMKGQKIPALDSVDYTLNQILLKSLEPNPENRYQSAAQLRKDLEKYSSRIDEGETIVPSFIDNQETIVEEPLKKEEVSIPLQNVKQPVKSNNKAAIPKIMMNVLIALLCVGLGIGGYLLLGNKSSEKSDETTSETSKTSTNQEETSEKDTTNTTTPTEKIFGSGAAPTTNQGTYYVNVQKGYLALRTAMVFDDSNIIGQMYNGDYVLAIDTSTDYWYVYSPTLGMYGYTNQAYLTTQKISSSSITSGSTYYASVETGYLALRSEREYNDANIIGKIENGQAVQVLDTSYGQYWYVYVPTLDAYGFVNSDYLVQ